MQKINIYGLIGARIRALREQSNMTQVDLASLTDMEKTAISRIEAGRTNITIKTLYKISQALNTSIKDIVDIDL